LPSQNWDSIRWANNAHGHCRDYGYAHWLRLGRIQHGSGGHGYELRLTDCGYFGGKHERNGFDYFGADIDCSEYINHQCRKRNGVVEVGAVAMKPIILIALAVALHAEDAPKPTPEQQEIAKLRQDLADAQAEIRLYQQGLFQCQASEIHAQAKQQAVKPQGDKK
jgi:hypothetical protein